MRLARLFLCLSGAVAFVAACVGEDPDRVAPGSSSSSGDGGGPLPGVDAGDVSPADGGDAQADGGHCGREKSFGAPVVVAGWSDPGSYHTTALRLVGASGVLFASDRDSAVGDVANLSNLDLYRATRADGGLVQVARLDTLSVNDAIDTAPTETADGKWMFLSRGADDGRRLWRSDGTSGTFTAPTALAGDTVVSGAKYESDPFVVGSSRLYFTAGFDKGESAPYGSLYVADLASGSPSSPAPVLGFADSNEDLRFPVVTGDELEIFYGKATEGQTPYRATRNDKSSNFGSRSPVFDGAMTIPSILVPSAISADGCDLYLAGREPTSRFQMYRATRR